MKVLARIILLSSIMLLPWHLLSQEFSTVHVIVDGFHLGPAQEIINADMDCDGDLDILLADGDLHWIENDGNGNYFNLHLITDELESMRTIGYDDMDGDGDMDIVSGGSYGEITLSINDGNGNYTVHDTVYTSGVHVRSICLSDLDNDNLPDIIIGRDQKLEWIKNMGNNIFEPHDLSGEGTIYRRVRSMDLNGDGYPEVVCSSASQEFGLELYINDGVEQVFTRQVLLDSSAYGLSIADLNGDGWEDIIVAHIMAQKVIWFENLGDSVSSTYQILTDECVSPFHTAFADLDEDNDLDIIIGGWREDGSYNDGATYFCLNDGAGTFAKPVRLDAYNRDVPDHYPADVDGDGDSDIICASFRNGKISWFENDNVNFDKEIFINAEVEGPSMVRAADLDNDGDNEVIVSSRWSKQLSYYDNMGDGIFGSKHVIENYGIDLFALADFDSDGYIDIASDYCDIAWHRNLEGGGFELMDCIDTWTTYYNSTVVIETADLDQMNGPDIIAACDPHYPQIAWVNNTGGGILGEPRGIRQSVITDAFPADLDGDGDIDIISNEYGFSWYENNGDASYFYYHEINIDLWLDKVFVSDVDTDGDLDIIGASSSTSSGEWIGWIENDGNGQFTEDHIVFERDSSLWVTDLLVCDLDLDQDPDILCTYHKGNYLAWFQNNGTGEFGEMKIISNEQITPESVFASDLDNDGDPDILCASASDNKVLWYENDTDYSISDPNLDSRLYPNPSNGIVYLTGAEKGIARVFSSNGVLIYQISCSGKTKIDLSSQTQGIYIISFTGKSGLRLNRKVAIIKSH